MTQKKRIKKDFYFSFNNEFTMVYMINPFFIRVNHNHPCHPRSIITQ